MTINKVHSAAAPRQPSSYTTPAVLDETVYIAVRQSWNGGSWSLDPKFMGETPDDVWMAVHLDEATKGGQTYRAMYGAVIHIAKASIIATVRPQDCLDIPELNPDLFHAAQAGEVSR